MGRDKMPALDDADLGKSIDPVAQAFESCASREKRFQNDDAHLEPR